MLVSNYIRGMAEHPFLIYKGNMKDHINGALFILDLTILYLVPNIYGTVRFHRVAC